MDRRRLLAATLCAPIAGCALPAPGAAGASVALLRQQVTLTELAFAKTMADRDHAAFSAFLSDEAVFLNSGQPLRGKAAVAAHWKRFFETPAAPFSWKPDLVEVLDSGTLAQSIGPVAAPDGTVVARFYSTWRLEPGGVWRIVFDDGYDVCRCAPTK
jgi:ketosteroid isomerase-like protein